MIVVCGEALIDFIPAQVGTEQGFIPQAGGSPYNTAIGLARLGTPTAFLGKLSTDPFGKVLKDNLLYNDVSTELLREGDEPSTLAFVVPTTEGEHDFSFYGSGTADQNLSPSELPKSFPEDVQAIHFGSYSLMLGESAATYQALMQREHRQRVVSLDPNVRPAMYPHREEYRKRMENLIGLTTIVKASEDDIEWLYPNEATEDVVERWLELGPSLVIVTLGNQGARGFSHSFEARVPAHEVEVVDTVGAGDAFTSGLLTHSYERGLLGLDRLSQVTKEELGQALAFANKVASITCTRSGANPPFASEVS